MRMTGWLAALGLALVLVRPAPAQWLNFLNVGSAPQTQQIVTPVAANTPINGTQSAPTASKLTSFMGSWITPMSNQTSGVGQSNWPTYNDMPGLDYLKAFHYGRGVSIVP